MLYLKNSVKIICCVVGFLVCQCSPPSSGQDEDSRSNLSAQIPADLRVVFSSQSEKNCDDFALFSRENIRLENNTWNTGNLAAGSFTQCIYKYAHQDQFLWGWEWSYPEYPTGINAYPELIFGKKPWHPNSTTTKLPLQVDAIQALKASYEVAIARNDGEYNLAFDNWITIDEESNPEAIRFEFMIWEDFYAIEPFGQYQATVDTSNGSYRFYTGEPDWEPEGTNWTYLAFVRTDPRTKGTVDIDELLQYLIQEDIVPSNAYLSSIEFGTEVGNSSGYAVVKNFNITLH